MDTGDWRNQFQNEFRQRIVNKIMDTLKRHLPFSGQEDIQEFRRIATRFEEKNYTAATSQFDYLRKISLKMMSMETKSQNTMTNSLPINSGIMFPHSPAVGMNNIESYADETDDSNVETSVQDTSMAETSVAVGMNSIESYADETDDSNVETSVQDTSTAETSVAVGMNNIESYADETDDSNVETSVQDTSVAETSSFSASTVQSECRLTIKVNYEDCLYTFRLSSSSEILELSQQVSQRLNLEDGTYDVKYLDDDNDWILLTCTEDLRLYIESSMRQESYTLMLTIEPK